MISKFVKEQKRYTQTDLCKILECSEQGVIPLIRKLKEYGILKVVKATDSQKQLSDLMEEDIELADVEVGSNELFYVFTFVGVIMIAGMVLKCYPKYIHSQAEPTRELKQILKVIEQYNSKRQAVRLFNEDNRVSSFNRLPVLLYLLQDYFENGVYVNTDEIIESNGNGEILWEKTINETFTILANDRPYYIDLKTKRRKTDDFDYFKRLHECVISLASKELEESGLLELFELTEADLSNETVGDFGDYDYVLYRIEQELNVQFNTRKQLILKMIYAYIAHQNALDTSESLCFYGTNSFNLVWEDVCSDVFNNQLSVPIKNLKMPVPLSSKYAPNIQLIDVIDKPKWIGISQLGQRFWKEADTLIPDIVSVFNNGVQSGMFILDAKYYNIQLDYNKPLRGQPGIESITKQYLYHLAYREFAREHGLSFVKNCFLMPTEEAFLICTGEVSLKMMDDLGLEKIQVRSLPATQMFELYLSHQLLSLDKLQL